MFRFFEQLLPPYPAAEPTVPPARFLPFKVLRPEARPTTPGLVRIAELRVKLALLLGAAGR